MVNEKERARLFVKRIQSKNQQKISLNLAKDTVEQLDELGGIMAASRTFMIEAILNVALKEYVEQLDKSFKEARTEFSKDAEIMKNLDVPEKKLKIFRKKWKI